MTSLDIYQELAANLAPEERAQVLAALRQDALVWARVQVPTFFERAARFAGSEAARWSPARLALLALEVKPDPEAFLAAPVVEEKDNPALLETAMQVYHNARGAQGSAPQTLEEAGLLALALRERRRQQGNWSFLSAEVQQRSGPRGELAPGWRLALACLYGFVSDADALLRALLPPAGGKPAFECLVHARLSQPAPLQSHLDCFLALLKGQPLDAQLGVLRSLSLHGQAELTGRLAALLAADHPAFATLRQHAAQGAASLAAVAARAFLFQQLAALVQLSGNRVQAASLLQSAEGALRQWMAGLSLQGLHLSGGVNGAASEARLQAVLEQARFLEGELGVGMAGCPLPAGAWQKLPASFNDPVLQIRQAAQMAAQGETLPARELAAQAAAALIERVSSTGLPFWGDFVYEWAPQPVIRALAGLGLGEEALALAQALIAARPVDVELLHEAGLLSEQLGDLNGARQYAQAAATLQPQSPDWHRRLGQLWMLAAAWPQAQAEFEAVLAFSPQPAIPDRLALAQAALNGGALERVIEVCDEILKETPDHGVAAGLLGRALAARGEQERALAFLSRATRYAPTEGAPWLALAQIQRDRRETTRALETLRSAVLAIPAGSADAAAANLALGEVCLECGLLAEALPALRQAYNALPGSVQAAYGYGRTLLETGKAAEALTVLENTRPAWAENRQMAYTYALAAREARNLEGMIAALEAALRPGGASGWEPEPSGESCGDPSGAQAALPVQWRLLYIRALLGDLPEFRSDPPALSLPPEVRLYRAEQAVRCILTQEPAHYEARFYQAQLFMERGDPAAALRLYQALAEIQPFPEHELYGRVQWGIGRAALRLGQVDTALAALKEAAQIIPDSLLLQRDLAEAFVQADLPHEALAAAQLALQLAPDQVDNLVWYAHFVAALGERRVALDALECAVQLEPERCELRILLAEWQIQAGQPRLAQAHLAAMRSAGAVSGAALRRAAELYLMMDDALAALDCLERAVQAEAVPGPDLLYELARLLHQLDRDEAALAVVQQALTDPAHSQSQESIRLYLLQSDLLQRLGRSQAAQAALEKALRVTEELLQAAPPEPAAWLAALREELGEIHEQFCNLLVELGSLPEAFYHAEQALAIHPERAALRYKAAGLAFASLQIERAAHIAGVGGSDHQGLNALRAELALELAPGLGSVTTVSAWEEETAAVPPAEVRLLAARARRLARRGEWLAASEAFDAALAQTKAAGGHTPVELWLAEAALETQQWTTALAIFDAYASQHPHETRAHFALARALVICAERRRLCEALDCRAHAPDPLALGDAAYQRFQEAIRAADHLAKNQTPGGLLIRRWQARGEAAFHPTVQSARDLAALPHSPEDTAALVRALGLLGRGSAVAQAAQRSPDAPEVRLQLALHHMQGAEGEGLAVARALAAEYLANPLIHALHGRLAALSGADAEALEAYQRALGLWPDEAGWHDAAGDLAFRLDRCLEGMTHREQALALEPHRALYALKLGEACLTGEGAQRAVEVLEAASKIERDCPEIWLALARAYRQAGKPDAALEAALQVAQVDPASGQGDALAAEIALSLGRPELALTYARSAVQREPDDAPALLMLAKVLELQGQAAEAIAALEQAPASVRDTYVVLFERARLLYRLKGAPAVLDILEKLAGEHGDDPDLLTFLAFAQYECGNLRAAERSGFKSLRLNPSQPELTLMLGRLEHQSGQLDQAVHLLSEAVRLAPDHLEALLELGAVYQERRESQQALRVYREAMRLAPNDYRPYYQSGLILRDNKDYPGAERMLRRAVELAHDNTGIRRQLLAVIALNLVHHKQEVGVG